MTINDPANVGMSATGTALAGGDAENLQSAILKGLFSEVVGTDLDKAGEGKSAGVQASLEAIQNAIVGSDMGELSTDPSYLGTLSKPVLQTKLGAILDDTKRVKNYESWRRWNEAIGLGPGKGGGHAGNKLISRGDAGVTQGAFANLLNPPKNYGAIKWDNDPQPYKPDDGYDAPPEAASWKSFFLKTFGDRVKFAQNMGITELFERMDDPHFYNDLLAAQKTGEEEGKIREAIKAAAAANPLIRNYAPFGYIPRGTAMSDLPTGSNNSTILEDWIAGKPAGAPLIGGKVEEAQEDGGEAQANALVEGVSARGFVPNFSAVAGEITAAANAGYASKVSPSQVKSMNIPGVGKTTYNTQESVFQAKGMRQPFIAPPASSEAAKGYSSKVQKKFGFNPYEKSADGFIPNFAASDTVTKFMNALDSFADSLAGSGGAFTEASKELKDASQAVVETEGSETKELTGVQELNQGLLLNAAGLGSLEARLNQGVDLNGAETLKSSMDALASSFSNLNVEMSLKVEPVNVNITAAADMATDITNSVSAGLTAQIAEELNKQKDAIAQLVVQKMTTG
jgi:hypothetical protein